MKRSSSFSGLVGVGLVLVALAPVGCSTPAAGVSCSPGTTVACSCQGALTGQATCDSSGREGACLCAGGSGGSSGGSSDGGSGGSSGSSGSSSGGLEAGVGVDAASPDAAGVPTDAATGG